MAHYVIANSNECTFLMQTDGKAAQSLVKLQLFQHFYVLGESLQPKNRNFIETKEASVCKDQSITSNQGSQSFLEIYRPFYKLPDHVVCPDHVVLHKVRVAVTAVVMP